MSFKLVRTFMVAITISQCSVLSCGRVSDTLIFIVFIHSDGFQFEALTK